MNSRRLYFAAVVGAALLWLSGCDRKSSVIVPGPQPLFSADINVVRDYNMRRTIAEFTFRGDGDPVPHGVVRLNDTSLTDNIGGVYSLEAPLETVFDGLNTVEFTSPRDNYNRSIAIHLPDSFGVTNINPRDNRGVVDATVQWSRPDNAAKVLLVVVARNYPINNSSPYMVLLDDEVTTHVVPYTVFQDQTGFDIRDIYYVYLAAFEQGFGPYEGLEFPLPINLPRRRISNPSGFATYGTVAPVDSIMVLP